jgi:hypothetical protein
MKKRENGMAEFLQPPSLLMPHPFLLPLRSLYIYIYSLVYSLLDVDFISRLLALHNVEQEVERRWKRR